MWKMLYLCLYVVCTDKFIIMNFYLYVSHFFCVGRLSAHIQYHLAAILCNENMKNSHIKIFKVII